MKKTDYQIIRESKNYSLVDWSKLLELPYVTVWRYENEERLPQGPARALYRLCREYLPEKKEKKEKRKA